MMYRNRILVSGAPVVLLLATFAQGCSSESGDDASTEQNSMAGATGSGGRSMTPATGGTTAESGGSSSSSGGGDAAPSAGGGTVSSGGSTPGTVGPCGSGISNGVTICTAGCTGGICGLADLGRRDCDCVSGVYQCASCAFTTDEPILMAPDMELAACPSPEASIKGTACTMDEQGNRCQPEDPARVCACWNAEWDCDKKPWPI